MKRAAPIRPAMRRRLDGWLRGESRCARVPLRVSVAAGLAGGVALIGQCWLLARIVDALALDHGGLSEIAPCLYLLLLTVGLRVAATVVAERAAFEAGARMRDSLRERLVAHAATLGPTWARTHRAGEVVGTWLDATESVGRYCSGYLPQAALAALIPLAILAFVIPTDWVSGLIMALSAPLVPLFMILIGKGTEALNQAQWRRLAHLGGHLFDAVEGLTTLKLFGASRAEADAVATLSDTYRRATMAVLRVAFLSSLVLEFLATLSIAMVAVYIGFRLYYGAMHLLPGLAVLMIAPEFFRVLRALGSQYHARMEAVAAGEAILALLETPPPPAPAGTRDLPGPVRTVRFEQVWFGHGAAPVLRGVDLALARGRCVAIVGASGAGKTTMADLLLGFLAPDSGRITVDGLDLAAIRPESWRARIAWLPQRPVLFHGTIRDNIRLGRPDADEAALRQAVARAGAEGLIAELPDGYDTVVGDRGQDLSGGEIQRVALARAFLRGADLLVLDEPATGLDAANAALIAASVRALCADCAVLVIAHDTLSVRGADAVFRLTDGRLVPVTRPGDATGAAAPPTPAHHAAALP
ncbi:ATP-binding cassette, subfamily C, CydD [Methylobacterium phyllostachyos]|uniref:ATP-binding cassette, subfamily C, CydD n=1 Tax=Methylobacterium phyllostachyos TaxID=582672 RepID=A0A1G9VXK4_9HYPH|nr:thiol reductant ABC exporter subunit CydD [Methylobacterium phyllostachyos]SDM76940.1 ATP-binding cassette, subfamily C, CydD [Methylobacterium phyllostachyos]